MKIIYSTPNGVYVQKERKPGMFTVWVPAETHAVKKATFHFSNDPQKALRLAMERARLLGVAVRINSNRGL